MNDLRFLIIGHGGAGKDVLAQYMSDYFGLTYLGPTSKLLSQFVFDHWGCTQYATPEDCWNDRYAFRMVWADLVEVFNAEDPAALARMHNDAGGQIYTGMRRRREYNAAKELFDVIIYLDATDVPFDVTFELTPRDAMYYYNHSKNGSLGLMDLLRTIERIIDAKRRRPATA